MKQRIRVNQNEICSVYSLYFDNVQMAAVVEGLQNQHTDNGDNVASHKRVFRLFCKGIKSTFQLSKQSKVAAAALRKQFRFIIA